MGPVSVNAQFEQQEERQFWNISGLRVVHARRERLLNLSRLRREDRVMAGLVWQCIQRSRPDLADLIQSDAMQEAVRMFDADIHMVIE